MTDDRSLERAARSWLEEGPTVAPDRPVEAALARIQTTPQDRAPFSRWDMTSVLQRLAIPAAVAAVVIGLVTYGQLSKDAQPTSPSSISFGGPSLVSIDRGRVLPAATYYLTGLEFVARFSVTLPEGWSVVDVRANHVHLENTRAMGLRYLTLVILDQIYPNPCHLSDGPVRARVPATGLVAQLSSLAGFKADGLKDARIGLAQGKMFTLSNSVDTATSDCAGGDMLRIGTYVSDESDPSSTENVEVAGGSALPMWAVDVEGATALIIAGVRDASPASFEAAQDMIDSIWFMSYDAPVPDLPVPSSLDRTFISTANEVSFSYPAAWVVQPAADHTATDWIEVRGARFTVRTVPLPAGESPSDWLARFLVDPAPSDPSDPETAGCARRTPIRVGRVDGLLLDDNCHYEGSLSLVNRQSTAIAVANGHGYVFRFDGIGIDTTAWLKAFLETVAFRSG